MYNLLIKIDSKLFSKKPELSIMEASSANGRFLSQFRQVYDSTFKGLFQDDNLFDEDDSYEISRQGYKYVGGGEGKTISDCTDFLERKGVKNINEQYNIIALLLQTKIGAQFGITAVMTGYLLELSRGYAGLANKQVSFEYDKKTGTAYLHVTSDVINIDPRVKIGTSGYTLFYNYRTLDLGMKNAHIKINAPSPFTEMLHLRFQDMHEHANATINRCSIRQVDMIKYRRRSILTKISDWFNSLFAKTITHTLSAKVNLVNPHLPELESPVHNHEASYPVKKPKIRQHQSFCQRLGFFKPAPIKKRVVVMSPVVDEYDDLQARLNSLKK